MVNYNLTESQIKQLRDLAERFGINYKELANQVVILGNSFDEAIPNIEDFNKIAKEANINSKSYLFIKSETNPNKRKYNKRKF